MLQIRDKMVSFIVAGVKRCIWASVVFYSEEMVSFIAEGGKRCSWASVSFLERAADLSMQVCQLYTHLIWIILGGGI